MKSVVDYYDFLDLYNQYKLEMDKTTNIDVEVLEEVIPWLYDTKKFDLDLANETITLYY